MQMSNSKITLINGSCADQEVDVVVNAANGGGLVAEYVV